MFRRVLDATVFAAAIERYRLEIPVLEGYRCAIEQAKLLVNLRVDASGLAFPSDHTPKWRRKKII
jgi:hypothetical protein